MPTAIDYAAQVEKAITDAVEQGRKGMERAVVELQNARQAAAGVPLGNQGGLGRLQSSAGGRLKGLGRISPLFTANSLVRQPEHSVAAPAMSQLAQETSLVGPAVALTEAEIRKLSEAFEKDFRAAFRSYTGG